VKANIIMISNLSTKPLVLYPLNPMYNGDFIAFCKPDCCVIIDLVPMNRVIFLEECYFQFLGMKGKIKPKNINNHNVSLEYAYYDREKPTPLNIISIVATPARAIKNDVYANK
jgi:hypothetical protein